MIHKRNRPGRAVGDTVALLTTLGRYWLRIYPIARQELDRWRALAATIPDAYLRGTARATLASEGLNAEGAALFAILAPSARRTTVVRLLVRFQVMYDYLDALTEQPAGELLRTSLHLHRALTTALGDERPTESYYAHHPHRDDGGYLDALVAGCRASLDGLPAAKVVVPAALRAARRSAEGQSHSHAAVFTGREELIRWARSATPPTLDLHWWETAAAAESSLVIHALLASAADPDLTHAAAERVAGAYWPWITGLNALLDDLVDRAEDAAEGTHSYTASYATPGVAARRLGTIASRATAGVRGLPRAREHATILAAMTSLYLAAPGAAAPDARAAALRVRRHLDTDIRLLLAMLGLRRRLAGGG